MSMSSTYNLKIRPPGDWVEKDGKVTQDPAWGDI
ncbi:hypothetical protein SLEP1_g50168 [Rubroshorea leprosula]|uniref:Uncharacterized protein n=1 Tax=Rubroshorea leprosula TaxID=152421 RepID=A0AAV5LZ43_9ROSI|nr:hypothetical protein SLEP1_g50168 [Rubroshorea leprosula]